MVEVTLGTFSGTGRSVTADHFGGNAIWRINTDGAGGAPSDTFTGAVDALGITNIRYPAGVGDAGVVGDGAGGEGIDVTAPNARGGLNDDIVNFMDWVRTQDTAANPVRATIVIPTKIYEDTPDGGNAKTTKFVSDLLAEYGDLVGAIEIGNEYWKGFEGTTLGMGEAAYGAIADQLIGAVADGIAQANAGAQGQLAPSILVQMAATFGQSDYGRDGENADLGFFERIDRANADIIDQLSATSRGAVDGVVEHYYYRTPEDPTVGYDRALDGAAVTHIDRDIAIWQNAAGFQPDLEVHITEWNIRSRSLDNLGMKAATAMVTQFEYMIQLGVTDAFVWPVQHNISSDLAGTFDRDVTVDGDVVINSIGGAVFDLMSSSLVGLELMETDVTDAAVPFTVTTYASADTVVFYVGSRAQVAQTVAFDVSGFLTSHAGVSAVRVGQDMTSERYDGQHFSSVDGAQVDVEVLRIDVDGDGTLDNYSTNEHDVLALITRLSGAEIGDDGSGTDTQLTFDLLPYELIEITYVINDAPIVPPPDAGVTEGTQGADTIDGTAAAEVFFGYAGDDSITGRGGADTLFGGLGNDTVLGNDGNDEVYGGAGADWLEGGTGNDLLFGGAGGDRIAGEDGADTIAGGDREDLIFGGVGADLIYGGNHFDTIFAGAGNDTVWGGNGRDVIALNQGDDVFFDTNQADASLASDSVDGGLGNDTLMGWTGDDWLSGGAGNDVVFGSIGNDTLWGGHHDDSLFGGIGDDTLRGQEGNDLTIGGLGDDLIFGGLGADTLLGREGGDTLDGGAGNDQLNGEVGDDTLFGNAGNDTLGSSVGNDVLTGGSGADQFDFFAVRTLGNDSITDFELGVDRLRFWEVSHADLDLRDVAEGVLIAWAHAPGAQTSSVILIGQSEDRISQFDIAEIFTFL